tara:strand:- start:792 stop:968 length:177 start_codon:yes stop_codon:yes gene_type:complete
MKRQGDGLKAIYATLLILAIEPLSLNDWPNSLLISTGTRIFRWLGYRSAIKITPKVMS